MTDSDEITIKRIGKSKAYEKPRNVYYWRERKELYVGYTGGKLCVFKAGDLGSGAIYSVKAHDSDITSIKRYTKNILITCSKDRCIKFWGPPESWEKDASQLDNDDEDSDNSDENSSHGSDERGLKRRRLGSDDSDEEQGNNKVIALDDPQIDENSVEENLPENEKIEDTEAEATKSKKRKYYDDSSDDNSESD